ncbi:hypothetical protein CPB85DRAFT_1278074 [Mucidula mucida]|nr:hypothetical protein CPB85DRAFT_1278074 [Mucidula mucida]
MSVHTPFVHQIAVPSDSSSSSTGSRNRRPNVRHYVHHLSRNGPVATPRPRNMTVTDENGRIRPEHRHWLHEADESPVMPARYIPPRHATVPSVVPSPSGSPMPEPFIPPPPIVQGPLHPAAFLPPPPPSAWFPHNTPIGPLPPNSWMAPGMPTPAGPPPPNARIPSTMHNTPRGPPPPNGWLPGAMPNPGGAMPIIYPNSPFIPGVTVQGMIPDTPPMFSGAVPTMPPVMPGIHAAGPSVMPRNNDPVLPGFNVSFGSPLSPRMQNTFGGIGGQRFVPEIPLFIPGALGGRPAGPGQPYVPQAFHRYLACYPHPNPQDTSGLPNFPSLQWDIAYPPLATARWFPGPPGNYQPEIMTALMSTDAFQPRSHAVVRFTSENEVLRYWMAPERWGPIRLEEARYWRLRELEVARRSGNYMRPGYLPERDGERDFLRSDVMGGHRRFYGCRHVVHDGVVMCSVEFIPGPIPQHLWLSTMHLV